MPVWPHVLDSCQIARAGGRGHRGAERSRSDAAGALDAGSGEPMMGAARGMGIPAYLAPGGGGRAGKGWRTGTAWAAAAAPLPLSYTRVGIAVRYPAGWCPSLRARVADAFTDLTGIVPATASVPVRHQLMGGQAVISAQTNPASSRATAVMASPRAFPWLVRCRYLPFSRRCAFQDRARVPGSAPACRRRRVAPIAGACWYAQAASISVVRTGSSRPW